MDNIYRKTIIGAITGICLYVCWRILPPIKERLVQKGERKLKKHGLYKHYRIAYKVIKIFLYILLAVMILTPIIFFVVVALSSNK